MTAAAPSRPACYAVTPDGLHVGTFPVHCTSPERCRAEAACFWRKFHGLPPDKFRAAEPEGQRELFA